MCRGIRQVKGRRISRVSTPKCSLRPIRIAPSVSAIQKCLRDEAILDITRLGKRVLLHTEEYALILQPRMAGLVSLGVAPSSKHIRLQIDFHGEPDCRLLYWDRRGLGSVELIRNDEVQSRIVVGRLGPDALQITSEDFATRLAKTSRAIKVALLDQKLLAGVGNLYASEMLHVAGIHPATPAAQLSKSRIRRLYNAMQDVLLTAIEHEGSTLSDGTYRNALNDPGSYQNQHRVYDRAGAPCPKCSAGIVERIVQAQRSTFFCSRCQKT